MNINLHKKSVQYTNFNKMNTCIKLIFALTFLAIGIYSALSIYRTGYIYEKEDIKDCKDLWYSILLSCFAFIIIGLLCVSYLIWKCLCTVVCDEEQNGCSFTCFRFVMVIGAIATFTWEIIHFVKQNEPCYQVYKKDYTLLWICFYTQTISMFVGIFLLILAYLIKLCCRDDDDTYYQRIV